MGKFQYSDELPPLSETEIEALRADLKENGQLSPIIVDEDGNILDGRHRWDILTRMRVEKWTETVTGLTELGKRAFPHNSQNTRRNMTPEQKAAQRERMKAIAVEMNADDWTQSEIAAALGVTQQAVSKWLATNTTSSNGCKKDGRAKLTQEEREEIRHRVDTGETQESIAEDFPVSRQAVAKVAAEEKPKPRQKSYNLSGRFVNALNAAASCMAEIRHEYGTWEDIVDEDDWNDAETDQIAGYVLAMEPEIIQLAKDIRKWQKTFSK